MKARDIIRIWRSDVDDTAQPYLWSDEEALDFLADAQNEACRRARLLVDSGSSEITRIVLVSGQSQYQLDPRVLFIRKARIAGSMPLARKNEQDMADVDPYWEDAAQSTEPRVFMADTDTGFVRFWPTPDTDGSIVLMTVVRDPLVEIKTPEDQPEINPRLHRSLRFWMTYRACMKPDEETFDPKKAEQALSLFEQEFGQKSSAIDEAFINREQYEGDGTF